MDEFTRECLTLRVEKRFSSARVLETLEFVFLLRGVPEYIRSDNGPEFIATALKDWLEGRDVKPVYVDPGSPWQNGYVESFHGKFRDECLNREVFASGKEATALIEARRNYYNTDRLHSSLGYRRPPSTPRRGTRSTRPRREKALSLSLLWPHPTWRA